LDYNWSIINQPDASLLNLDVFDYSDDHATATFTPDKSGKYEFEVSIFQYGDEISVQTFVVDIEGEDAASQPVELEEEDDDDEWVENEDDNKWFEEEEIVEESVQETLVSTMMAAPIKTIEKAMDVVVIQKKKPTPPPPPPPKPVIRPGSTIPKIAERFTIQVASKKILTDAEIVAASLIDNGYDAYIQKAYFKETDELWFRIRIGSYDSREAATLVAKSISEKRDLSTWVDFVRYEE